MIREIDNCLAGKNIQMKIKQNNNVETEILTKMEEEILDRQKC
jgi:hypothetical protein